MYDVAETFKLRYANLLLVDSYYNKNLCLVSLVHEYKLVNIASLLVVQWMLSNRFQLLWGREAWFIVTILGMVSEFQATFTWYRTD